MSNYPVYRSYVSIIATLIRVYGWVGGVGGFLVSVFLLSTENGDLTESIFRTILVAGASVFHIWLMLVVATLFKEVASMIADIADKVADIEHRLASRASAPVRRNPAGGTAPADQEDSSPSQLGKYKVPPPTRS